MKFELHGAPVGGTAIGVALMASMGGFIFGFDTGQISDILIMPDFLERFGTIQADGEYGFTHVREGLIVALLSVGTAIGALCGAPLADGFGRRKAMSIDCFVFSLGIIVQVTAFRAWYQIAIGRLIAGLGVGALSAAVPAYQSETSPKEIRGTLIATYQLFITLGILVAYGICIGSRYIGGEGAIGSMASAQWRLPIALSIVFAVFLGVGIMFMPESPRWLMARGRNEEAAISLARVRGLRGELDHPLVARDYAEIEAALDEQRARERESGGELHGLKAWKACFKPGHKVLYRTGLGMTLQALQQLTGANYFFYYGASIFSSVGISDPFVVQIILGAVNFFCTFGGLYILERFGRRRPLILGGLWQGVWLMIFASVGVTCDTQTKTVGTVLIVSACLFIASYAVSWAPGVWILIGETFPSRTRAKQGALSTTSNWVWNFLIAFCTPFVVDKINFGYGYVFAGCNIFGAVFVYFFLYESSGLSLEAVDVMYNDPNCKPWTSVKWAPPGYTSRKELEKNTHGSEDQHTLAERKRGDEKATGMMAEKDQLREHADEPTATGSTDREGMRNEDERTLA